MAPIKKIKTYQNPKKQKIPSHFDNIFNELVTNLTISSDKSHDKSVDTTFDRLLKGKTYNGVVLLNFPNNKCSINEETNHSIILECTKDDFKNKTDNSSDSNQSEFVNYQSKANCINQSDADAQTCVNLETNIFKSLCDRSPIITRSKPKFASSFNFQTERESRVKQLELSQTEKNTSSQYIDGLQLTQTSNSFLSTKKDSVIDIPNVSKHRSIKESNHICKDNHINKRKYKHHFHLNVSSFKFELLMNKGSTPLPPSLERAKYKSNTFRSIKNISLSRSIEGMININEQYWPSYKDNTGKYVEENILHSKKNMYTSTFSKQKNSSLPNCDNEIVKTLSTEDQHILNDNSLTEEDKSSIQTIENNSRINISSPTKVKSIGNNFLKKENLKKMSCSSLKENEIPEFEYSSSVRNSKNLMPFPNEYFPNQSVLLTSTPLPKARSIVELIDISSENELDFTAEKLTHNLTSNVLQLVSNNKFKAQKDYHEPFTQLSYQKNMTTDYYVNPVDFNKTDQLHMTSSELRSGSFLHKQIGTNDEDATPSFNIILQNKTKNDTQYSQDEVQTEKANENNYEIQDKHIDHKNIRQTGSFNCSEKEINSNLEENDSENYDFVENSITSPQISRKYVSLAPGKKFRRSIIIHKSTLDSTNAFKGFTKDDIRTSHMFNRRTSIKFVPVIPMKAKMSELESYADYVSVQKEHLGEKENDFNNSVTSINFHSANCIQQSIIHPTARNIVLERCSQTEPLNFEKCYPQSALEHCQKIGEGVYGEVFMFRDENSSLTVMKIIPIEGDQIINLEKQKTFDEIISEIIISTELSNLRKIKCNNTDAFTEVKNIRCVQGRYPQRLLELWELYDENKHSENDSPEIFCNDQLYIVLELSNGGRDLEAFEFRNAQQSLAVFNQIACAIAVAEEELHFEHRDLHWGNVLVVTTKQKYSHFILKEKEIIINNKDAKATIIDFTLSRIKHEGVVIFNDLASDQDLFNATGDYQFEIYRLMQKSNGNEWQSFKPYSNILWLHYILDKATTAFRYKNIKSKLHKNSLKILQEYKNKILDYQSVTNFVIDTFV